MNRNIIAGLIFLACTLSSIAFSQVPNQKDIDGAKERCSTEHSSKSAQDITLRAMCLQSIDVYVLRQKQEAGDKSVASAIADLQGKLDEKFKAQNVELKALIQSTVASAMKSFGQVKPPAESQAKRDTAPVQDREKVLVSPPTPRTQAPMLGSGVSYQVVRAAGSSFAATTYPAGMRSFIQFAYLSSEARDLFHDKIPFRVLVLKNGVPLSVAGPLGVNQSFYADLDKDGKPDPEPYHGVNPAFSDDVYVGFLPGDNIRLVFLRETGYYIQISGLPVQTLWGDAINVQYFLPKHAGGWKILAAEGLREY